MPRRTCPATFRRRPELTRIKLLLAERTGQSLKEARAWLEAMDEKMHQIHRNNVRIDVLALQALVCDAQGDEVTALQKLRATLELGSIGGNIRTFVDLGAPMADLLRRLKEDITSKVSIAYIDQIQGAFPHTVATRVSVELTPIGAADSPANTLFQDPLTRRERQVLKLLATDLSSREIAAKLVISPATLHTHRKNIYRKLSVNKRAEAVQWAREFGLVA